MPSIVTWMIRWIARTAAFLIAAIFFAFVVGEPAGSFRTIHPREWVGFVLLFGSIAAMLVAWRWELPASLISLCALVAFAVVVHMRAYDVLAVAALPNLLFLLDWELRRLHPRHA